MQALPPIPNLQSKKSIVPSIAKGVNSSFFKPLIQPKLTINQPNDIYEQEADAVAEKVMRMPVKKAETLFFQPKPLPVTPVQRKCVDCEQEKQLQNEKEEEQPVQLKPSKEFDVQRKCSHCEEEEKKVQMKGDTNATVGMTAPSIVNNVIHSNGQSLDAGTKNFMESRFGYDFGNVQIHNDSLAHQSSADLNALAYTHGNHVVFKAGQYQPNSVSGKQLLAHELVHVIQQGKTTPLIQRKKSGEPEPGNNKKNKNISVNDLEKSDDNLSDIADQEQKEKIEEKKDPPIPSKSQDNKKPVEVMLPETAQPITPNNESVPAAGQINGNRQKKSFANVKNPPPSKFEIKNKDLAIPQNRYFTDKDRFSAFNLATKSIKDEAIAFTDSRCNKLEKSKNDTLDMISSYATDKFNAVEQYFVVQVLELSQEKLFKRLELERERATQKKLLNDNFTAQFNLNNKNYTERKKELQEAGSSRSKEILDYSEAKASLMEANTRIGVSTTLKIGRAVVKNYEHDYNSEEIYNMAMDSSIDSAIKMKTQGAQTSAAIRKDGVDVSAKVNESVSTAQRTLDDMYLQAQNGLLKVFDESNKNIDETISLSQIKIDEAYVAVTNQIPVIKQLTLNSIQLTYDRFLQMFSRVNFKLQNNIRKAGAFQVQNLQSLAQGFLFKATGEQISGENLKTYLSKAGIELQSMNLQFQKAFEAFAPVLSTLDAGYKGLVIQGIERIYNSGISQTSFLHLTATTSATQMITETTKQVAEIRKQANESFGKEAVAFESNSRNATEKTKVQLELIVSKAKPPIEEKVTKVTESQTKQINGLRERIEEKAEELSFSNQLSEAFNFVGNAIYSIVSTIVGFVVGVIKAIVKLIVGLVVLIVAIVVAIVVIIVVVIAVFVLLVVFLGAELALLVAAIIGLVLLCLVALAAAVFIIYGIIMTVVSICKNIYKALTDDSLSSFERGELMGESLTDLFLLLLPFKGKAKAPALEGGTARGLLGAGDEGAAAATETIAVVETSAVTETAAIVETSAVTETAAVVETSAATETAAVVETSAVTETAAIVETSAATETAAAVKTSAVSETTAAAETAAVTETTAAAETSAAAETASKAEAPRTETPKADAARTTFEQKPEQKVSESKPEPGLSPAKVRELRINELAKDPQHGVIPKTLREAEVGLTLEEQGRLAPPIKRDTSGAAEFIDGAGTPWDVKGFNSNFPPKKGGFDLKVDSLKVESELTAGENVIVDTAKMTAQHIADLKAEALVRGWGDRVIFFP